MEGFLDSRTVATTAIFLSFCFGVGLLFYSKNNPKFQGVNLLSFAILSLGLASLLLILRNTIPDFMSIMGANLLIIYSFILLREGFRRFLNIPQNLFKHISITNFFIVFILFYYFTYITPSIDSRRIVISLSIFVQSFICAYTLFSSKNRKILIPSRTLSVFFVFIGIHQVTRSVFTFFTLNLYSNVSVLAFFHSTSVFLIQLIIIFVGFSVVLMTSLLLEEKLTEQSNIDFLTQTHNRRSLDKIASKEILSTINDGTSLSLVLCDIDHFKKINDLYGHQTGDDILVALSALLKNNMRKDDSVARYGGEEFVLFLPGTKEKEAALIAEKLRHIIDKNCFISSDDRRIHVTASFGVTSFTKHRTDWNTLMQSADKAMYQAKSLGRNQVRVFDESSFA